MGARKRYEYPPDHELIVMVNEKGSSAVADELGVSRGAVDNQVRRIRRRRAEVSPPGVSTDGFITTVASDPADQPPAPWKPESLLQAHGLDPDEWVILRVRANRWGEPDAPNHQLRVECAPKAGIVSVPDPTEWTPPPKPKKRRPTNNDPAKVVVCGDHHAPHHDRTLHRLFCEWLADERPDEGVLLGDLIDATTVSRHRPRDGWDQDLNTGLRAAFEILMDYRHASPDTRWTLLPGNHDSRIQYAVIDNVRGLHGIRAADDDVPALSLRRLLHLDELGIAFAADHDADWDTARAVISRRLVARHGVSTSKNATQVLLSKLASTSTIQGHSHRLGVDYRTEHDEIDLEAPTSTRMGAEAGCMAQISDGLGYTVQPDWQQGALLNWVYPDGDFLTAPIVYVPGRLLAPNGRRYEA
jgi:hypothetical protein